MELMLLLIVSFLRGQKRASDFGFKGTGSLSSGSLTLSPLPFSNKQPDRSHQMLSGNINIPFPENLRDPVDV